MGAEEHLHAVLQGALVYVEARVVVWVGDPLLLVACADEEVRARHDLLVGREVIPGHQRSHLLQGLVAEFLPYRLLDHRREPSSLTTGR